MISGSALFGLLCLALLGFQALLFGDVGFHPGDGPALYVGLAAPFDGQGSGGHILGDGAAGGGVSPVAHRHRRHQVGVAADEAVVPDGGAVLVLPVVVAGDGAAAEVAVFAHVAVADVGQVADGVAAGKVGVLGLHIGAQVDAVVGDGARADVGEGPDVVVGADLRGVDLAGVDGGAAADGAVLDESVGADDAARPDDGAAPQDGAGQDDSPRRDLDRFVNEHSAACDLHAVCDVPQQHRLAGGLGAVQRGAGRSQSL